MHAHVFAPPGSGRFFEHVDSLSPGFAEGVARFLSLLFSLNVLLGTFNLIPVPPLDGFNAIPILLSEEGGRRYLSWADSVRTYSIIGLVLGWVIFNKVSTPIFDIALRTLYR